MVTCGKFGSLYTGKAQQPQDQHLLSLSVCAVLPCVQTMVRLPVFGICKVHTDADACNCTQGAVQMP